MLNQANVLISGLEQSFDESEVTISFSFNDFL